MFMIDCRHDYDHCVSRENQVPNCTQSDWELTRRLLHFYSVWHIYNMVVARPICVITAFVLCHMTMGELAEQCCKSQESIFGMMLKGFVFKKTRVSSPIECLQACNTDFRCHSFNYVFAQDICELNNRTKEARPANFVKDFYRYYFKRNTKAG